MKVIFAGPTLHGTNQLPGTDYELRPPARQGDFLRAVEDGANVIGLIDGIYEHVPAIWHKEILFALAQGVQVFGAASMGALRAAECAAFGMIGIGKIYDDYASGALVDDADVAQSHGPAELGFLSLSEPLVNASATIEQCLHSGCITDAEHDRLLEAARATFFKDRTYKLLVQSSIQDPDRATLVLTALRQNLVNQKLLDAERLIDVVVSAPDRRLAVRPDWTFEATSFWNRMVSSPREG
ncbi:antibiotic resistance protein [Rhizobium sp. AC27/96]|uniref:TfuA-like protein n=1 Tax=Rhizobium sp. AC27/96 TaxID=1841653 RepID=UPI0008278E58|nr:TfuA-like protein [Rhizobium sp. AC27/96]OCI95585.1 antibiotic resistance protein [Rhizobium sp. AC27/96]